MHDTERWLIAALGDDTVAELARLDEVSVGYKTRWIVTPELEEEIAARYLAGQKILSIAADLGISGTSVRGAMSRRGVKSRPIGIIPAPLADRFWSKVAQGAPDECWLWMAHRDSKGYGWFRPVPGEMMQRAPRVAFFLTHGYYPECARHACDNPPCVNPAHILDGTRADNNRDKVERGRALRGERSPASKLTAKDVGVIRALRGLAHVNDLADALGVHPTTISAIQRRKSWCHI